MVGQECSHGLWKVMPLDSERAHGVYFLSITAIAEQGTVTWNIKFITRGPWRRECELYTYNRLHRITERAGDAE